MVCCLGRNMNLYLNELESIDINQLSLRKLSVDELASHEQQYFKADVNASNLRISSNIRTGLSPNNDMVLLIVKTNILDKPNNRYLDLIVEFFFSLNKKNEDREKIFGSVTTEAIPYISLELVNLVRNLTSQESNVETINLPYDFLKKEE